MALLCLACMAQDNDERASLRNEIEKELTGNILPFWVKHTSDPSGGFYGVITREGKGVHEAPKGAILGARLLWTFSQAYRLYGYSEYKVMADSMQQYFINNFIDKRYGGVYYTLTPDGAALDDTKQTYAHAFAIYGLAEHFRATGDTRSLNKAIDIFCTLEEKVHDHERGGYQEMLARDFSKTSVKGVDGHPGATKTMNTHIHLLEAFTTLYKVWPDESLSLCLKELIGILENRLYSPKTGHLLLYCDDDWNVLEEVDSYGHDIETSWLICEAAEALGDDDITARIRKQAVKMVDVAMKEGMKADGSVIYEKNSHGVEQRMSWWPQCEAVIGCINAWQITGKRKYFDQAVKTWRFIRDNFVDREYGGWFNELEAAPGNQSMSPNTRTPKGSMWNCPYHNSRMGFEMLWRLAEKTVHSEVMAWSNMTGVRIDGELTDFETALCVGVPGGKIEKTGRERQQNVKYRREGNTQIVDIPMHGAHFHQEVTDLNKQQVNLKWTAVADETLQEGAFFSMSLAPKHYDGAKIKSTGNKLTVIGKESNMTFKFNKKVTTAVRNENGNKVVYITLLPTLRQGEKAELEATLTIQPTKQQDKKAKAKASNINLDLGKPGQRFIGFGGNFRIQNPEKDPKVIDYCLKNMRVAMGRVEFPWAAWAMGGEDNPHVKASAQMAARLKAMGMPVVVSCWFPPQSALAPGSKRRSGGVAALRLDPAKEQENYEQMVSYLEFLKNEYNVEADYFSFNESDIGIDVLHTPEEHRDFIKGFGETMSSRGLRTRMLLGDNSDATTIDFIKPTLEDKTANRFVGAVSFHSWRGCDDETLGRWYQAARSIHVPLIVGEGSTDAAAWRYPAIFKESTFALYEINLYTRLCAICQPLSILQWQLTADYSLLQGEGILGDDGPLRPTQRFHNLWQLSQTPANGNAIPVNTDNDNLNTAAFYNKVQGKGALHIVNNGGAGKAEVSGLPTSTSHAIVYVTNACQNAEAQQVKVKNGTVIIDMPAESFVSVLF